MGRKPKKTFRCNLCDNKIFQGRRNYSDHLKSCHTNEKTFTCSYCSKEILTRQGFVGHLKTHLPKSERIKFKCSWAQCDKEYLTKSKLKEHVKQIHSGSPMKYGCNLCDASFTSTIGRNYHINAVHTGEKHYQCGECPAQFACLGNFRRHRVIHKDEKLHCCKICSKRFKHQSYLATHVKGFHSVKKTLKREMNEKLKGKELKFKCSVDQCSKKYDHKAGLKQHIEIIHTGIKYSCNFCSSKFIRKQGLFRHIMAVHTGEKSFQCKNCPLTFPTSGRLWSHKWVHKDERPHKCKLCPKRFKKKCDLTHHLNIVHSLKPKDFLCSLCQSIFPNRYYYNRHLISHFPQSGLPCYFCERVTSHQSSMPGHLRTHTMEKPFFCSEYSCKYSSAYFSNLQRHKRLHHNSPFSGVGVNITVKTCYFCPYTTTHNSDLARHIRRHTKELPFNCPWCPTSFGTNQGLVYHMSSHTKERPTTAVKFN